VDTEHDAAWTEQSVFFAVSHPRRYREFLARADGYTCIIESLLDFKPASVPGHVIRPACEPEFFDLPQAAQAVEKARWGIAPESPVLFYPGGVHENNAKEVFDLYAALGLLRRSGVPARMIKFGRYLEDFSQLLGERGLDEGLVDLTDKLSSAELPEVMRAADFLVQPGEDNPFNHYRFPCKLPMFLASARPVMLPESNLGYLLEHGKNCLLLRDASDPQAEICAFLKRLIENPRFASDLGTAGREFAREHFSWDKTAARLLPFYREILDRHQRSILPARGPVMPA
jgi:glycosyltransferase involved in cell wall biosynthesis